MYSKEITIVNKTGLHARPASDFASAAFKYNSTITLKRAEGEKTFNAKSIVSLMAMGLSCGEKAILSAEGKDEQQAVDDLAILAENLKD